MFSNSKPSTPSVFREIIDADKAMEKLVSLPVVPLKVYRDGKKLRYRLSQGAEKYIAEQKKGSR